MKPPGLTTPTRVVLLIACYVIGGLIGKAGAFMGGAMELVWPPAGIALAAILLFGYRFLPGVALGAVLFSFMNGRPVGIFTLGTVVGSSVGAMVCAYLLERFVQFRNSLDRVRDVGGFVLFAAALGTTVNAAFNAASLCLASEIAWERLPASLAAWWVPNALGTLVVTPLLLSWCAERPSSWGLKRLLEGGVCAVGLTGATMLSLNSWYVYGLQNFPLAYLPYPFLIWAALRFGQRGATTGTLVVAGLAIHALLHHRGPFVAGTEQESLVLIGTYISVLAVTNMLLAAAALEKEKSQQTVRESEARYRAVVEDQTEIICRFLADGTLTFVNGAFCRQAGRTRDELIGQNLLAQFSGADREMLQQRVATLSLTTPLVTIDVRVTLPDGKPGWLQCIARAIHDRCDRLIEYQMVGQDITPRKLAEEALQTSEERVRAILTDAIFTLGQDGRIESFNPAAEKIFGYTAAELATRNLAELLHEEDRERYMSYTTEQVRHDGARHIELRGRRQDGSVIALELAVNDLLLDARRRYVAVVRDISERGRLQAQLQQSQKLESVGLLANGIAHDFNNILTVVQGHASLLLVAKNTSPDVAAAAQEISWAAERAAKLTRQLLTFSRRQAMEPRPLNLNELVGSMTHLLCRTLGEDVALETDCSPDLPILQGDADMIEQIILNLAVNAREAMSAGGRLLIRTSARRIDAADVHQHPEAAIGDYVCLTISDTGCGIASEHLPRVFEPFFTTKTAAKRAGLGLATVYGMVKQHEGWVQLTSTVGRGATFQIFFPIETGRMQPKENVAAPKPADGRATILVVEDDASVRTPVAGFLERQGYQVLQAASATGALEIWRQHAATIHLLLTDIILPGGMTGWDLAARLRTENPRLKVIFTSGYSADAVGRDNLLREGANFIQKPCHPRRLAETVRERLDSDTQVVDKAAADPSKRRPGASGPIKSACP